MKRPSRPDRAVRPQSGLTPGLGVCYTQSKHNAPTIAATVNSVRFPLGPGSTLMFLGTSQLRDERGVPCPQPASYSWSFNPRMVRVAEKVGFEYEGRRRQMWYWQGEWLDAVHFGLLREEWEGCR